MIEMSVLETTLDLTRRGGWVMIPIFFLGWFAWTLLFERYFFYRKLRGASFSRFLQKWNGSGETEALLYLGSRRSSFLKRLVEGIVLHRHQGAQAVRNAMDEIRYDVEDSLSRSLKLIAVCTAIAPMLGLLGTVSGMVTTFETIRGFGFGNPVLLADGISEALLTTQAGLLVAFPLMLAYNHLVSSMEKMKDRVWSDAIRFESMIFEEPV
ncbi:MAG: MotA/TolQ/ExbB proton channel family protein [Fibrobacter sp.]|jgi:biopolymer transport protein ExbB|nr:MotA/TolQ/ExbB proton channel family protein [Fibrobacter sp.]